MMNGGMIKTYSCLKCGRLCLVLVGMVALSGCILENSAYYLEEVGNYRSWDELQLAATKAIVQHNCEMDPQIGVRDLNKCVESQGSSCVQFFLSAVTLSIVPLRYSRVRAWEAHAENWKREIRIREISHQSFWLTGMIPASFGADRRAVHCPDNNYAYEVEETFAEAIARALYIVETADRRKNSK